MERGSGYHKRGEATTPETAQSTGEKEPPGTAGKIQEGGAGTATTKAETTEAIKGNGIMNLILEGVTAPLF